MFNSVDLIGVEAVANMLKQTDLKRFIIYRQGAGKGSTPVYDCSHTTTNAAAVKSFKDWANNITTYNPNNFLCYEILAFNEFEENIGADPQNKNHLEEETRTGRKKGKMRISFALNAAAGSAGAGQGIGNYYPGMDIQAQIQAGIDAAVNRMERERLEKEIKELKKQLEESEEEEEEDEDGQIGNVIEKVTKMMGEINENNRMKIAALHGAQVNGDLENVTEDKTKGKKNIHGLSDAEYTKQKESLNKSLRILWENDKDLAKDLAKLAEVAATNKILFNMILDKLRAF